MLDGTEKVVQKLYALGLKRKEFRANNHWSLGKRGCQYIVVDFLCGPERLLPLAEQLATQMKTILHGGEGYVDSLTVETGWGPGLYYKHEGKEARITSLGEAKTLALQYYQEALEREARFQQLTTQFERERFNYQEYMEPEPEE